MITVWHMNGVMNAGGTESLIMNILRFRGGSINHVLVIHSKDKNEKGMFDTEIQQMGIKMLWLPSVGSIGVQEYKKQLKRLVDEEGKPDIIHSHLNAVGGIIAKAANQIGIEHRVVHCHADIRYRGSFVMNSISEIKLAIMKLLVNRYATDFFACSPNAANRLFYKPNRAIIINNAINVENYFCDLNKKTEQRKKIGVNNDTLLVGAVGRIARIKNYEVILKAVGNLVNNEHKIKFICYGRNTDESYYEELNKLIASLGIQENICFAGNSTNICDDIAAFDVFVMPSLTEGLGISALEAQAAGKKTLLSTGVPKAADVGLGLVSFLEPTDYKLWAKNILHDIPNSPSTAEIEEAFINYGYNASYEVKRIEAIYNGIMGGKYE